MQENDLVPYAASPLIAERLLVFAPHADDEVIGCGGLILQSTARQHAVRVAVVTDGRGDGDGAEGLAGRREDECANAAAILGSELPRFLRFRDRSLTAESIRKAIEDEIVAFRPSLIAAPSPIEIHPDHAAVSRAVYEVVCSDRVRFQGLERVAFYEVTQPIRPNHLIDMTSEAERKFRALSAYASQLRERDLVALSRALNRYRAFTLNRECEYAEAFWVVEAAALRRLTWDDLARSVSGAAPPQIIRSEVPVTVLIRTRERVPWLKDAVASVLANSHAAQTIVVNDGGVSPADLLPRSESVRVIDLPRPVGRSEAMNVAVRAATTSFVAFLDDDDVFYADHLSTLVSGSLSAPGSGYYTDALYVQFQMRNDATYERINEWRPFSCDFDRDLLLCDNYIPLPTLLINRERMLAAGGFDPKLDTFEDWDFLIRLSRLGPLVHIPRITCEVRIFHPSDRQCAEHLARAKFNIWRKHRDDVGNAVARLRQSRHGDALGPPDGEGEFLLFELAGDVARAERARAVFEEGLTAARRHSEQQDEELRRHMDEVKRLNAMLEQIYRSRTWRIHQLAEKVRRLVG